jgi:predicted amidohydrolase
MSINAIVAQFPISPSVQTNLKAIRAILELTEAGDLVLFPEGSVSGYSTDPSFPDKIEYRELQSGLRFIQNEAEKRKLNVWAGACINENGKWFNAAYGFTPHGKCFVYHKINLATHERERFSAGATLRTFAIETPDGVVSIGVQICRELRFPEQWGWLARSGAQIILHLNNATGEDRFQSVWRSHLISRAAETQRFVLSANNAAPRQISPTMAIAPDGQVMGEIVSAELETLRISLDLSQVSNWFINQSRTDVVKISSTRGQKAT